MGQTIYVRGTVDKVAEVGDETRFGFATDGDGYGWIPTAAIVTVPSEPSTDYCLGYADGLHHAKQRPHQPPTGNPHMEAADYRAGFVRGFSECLQRAINVCGEVFSNGND